MDPDQPNDDPREENQSKEDRSKKDKPDPQDPPPFPKKIPEPPGNLRKRAEWFRKRSE